MSGQTVGSSCVLVEKRKRTGLYASSLFILAMWAAGCGAPGEPRPPSPQIPVAVNDLEAKQAGDGVLLTFTMPGKSTLGDKLKEVPTVEILRGAKKSDGTKDEKSFRVADTVPGALIAGYVAQGKVQFMDPIAPEEMRGKASVTTVYRVRMRVSDKKTSANSNDVELRLYRVAERIATIETSVSENTIELKWTAPARTSGGEALSGALEYHVYRGELQANSVASEAKEFRVGDWKILPAQIGTAGQPEYKDANFDFGKNYGYVVRTLIGTGEGAVESSDSAVAVVTPKDIFPPAKPEGVVAAVLRGFAAGEAVVDLSWSISVETDLAGYRVYRSEEESARGELITAKLLPTPAYRDASAKVGKKYWYRVTAVDRAGNESEASAAVAVDVAKENE